MIWFSREPQYNLSSIARVMVSNTPRDGEKQNNKRIDTYLKVQISKRTMVIFSELRTTITLILDSAKFTERTGNIPNLE